MSSPSRPYLRGSLAPAPFPGEERPFAPESWNSAGSLDRNPVGCRPRSERAGSHGHAFGGGALTADHREVTGALGRRACFNRGRPAAARYSPAFSATSRKTSDGTRIGVP